MNDPLTIAAVGYLNTAPLIEGLSTWEGANVIRAVPSRIAPMILEGEADIGLASIVDFARAKGSLTLLDAGMIGCDGPTLTVRLFSSVPIEEIDEVHADTDSHTSCVLCDLILREKFGIQASFTDFNVREHIGADDAWPKAVLMIGDKVVTGSPPAVRYPHQIDLGQAWHELTGLPFVYAAWMTRTERIEDPTIINAIDMLEHIRLRNRARIDRVVTDRAQESGWPTDLAREYIGELLRFEPDDRAKQGAETFLRMSAAAGILPDQRAVWMNKRSSACLH